MGDDETVLLNVAADSASFRQALGDMRAAMNDELVSAADTASRGIETALRRAARNGGLAFKDMARVAAKALGEVAASALLPGSGGSEGLGGVLGGAAAGILGLAGRATGGPVSPGRAYMVGERGPEVFVPTASGKIETGGGGQRAISLTVNVAGEGGQSPVFMAQTARQVARGIRRALDRQGV